MTPERNVYSPPAPGAAGASLPPDGRPKYVTTIGVLTIILSALGLLSSGYGLLAVVTGIGQEPPPQQPGMPPGFEEAQRQMYEELREVSMPVVGGLFSTAGLVVEGLVLYGAVLLNQGRDAGRRILVGMGFPVVSGFTLVKLVFGLYVSWRTIDVIGRFMERLTAATPGGSDVGKFMNIAMVGGAIGGIAISLVWAGALVGFYLWARKRLQRPEVSAYYQRT